MDFVKRLIFSRSNRPAEKEISAAILDICGEKILVKKVQRGEAVFVFDDQAGTNHAGITPATVTDDNERRFDFVQELLNQVVARKRSVPLFYDIVGEDGVFNNNPDNSTVTAIYYLKEHFNIDNTSDNQGDFRKLMTDYNIPESEQDLWYAKIVDKKILIGDTLRVEGSTLDNRINSTPGNATNDTGLYELYVNVVKRFNDLMILSAERYAGVKGAPVPTDLWISRTGEGPVTSDKPHGKGMSYCYGCKDTIENFNETVANCRAESGVTIMLREGGPDENNKYRGNIDYYNCNVGQGEYDWNGLYRDEYRSGTTPFRPNYWAGIDCSGLVQRSAESVGTAMGNIINLPYLGRNSCQFFFTDAICSRNNYTPVITDSPSGFTYLFGPADLKTPEPLEKIRKGDLVSYAGHVTMVYSDNYGISQYRQTLGTMYDIIHAYGGGSTSKYNEGITGKPPIFARKVMITGNNIGAPIGFGRIKLWQ